MKNALLIIAVFVLFTNVYAQKKMTDRELAGLKGQVKSITNESVELETPDEKVDPDSRRKDSEEIYDEMGNIKSIVYTEGVLADNFSLVGGVKTLKPLSDSGNTRAATYKYVYDAKGRIVEERKYDKSGALFFKSFYKYNEKGQRAQEIWYDKNKMTGDNLYVYDAQEGYPVEIKYRMLDTTHRFKNYKFDAQGNWIERTQTTVSRLDGKEYTETKILYRTIKYY